MKQASIGKRKLGSQGLIVPSLGLGCMGMSWAYGKPDDEESLRTLRRSVEIGMGFWDTAEIYGPFKNEELLGKALKDVGRDNVIVATKFAWEFGPKGERLGLNSKPAHIKEAVEGSLKRLGTDHIDLYYQHRVDPNTPIEDTMQALADLVKAGKIRYVGLSEAGTETIRRAHAVHPVSALQSEYSLWEKGVEDQILPLLKELEIGFVPYSPMGRGFLTGTFNSTSDFSEGDSRLNGPRFQGENFEHNMRLVEEVRAFAESQSATPAQVTLAWLLRQGENIVPIPGTKRVKYLEQNAASVNLEISEKAWTEFDEKVRSFKTAGTRYAPEQMKLLNT
jgi:aryl-alcohol dehydrogenase-like predicted oxidoreductase